MKATQAAPPPASVPNELRLAAVALERRLTLEIQAYEERYEIRSADLDEALRSGGIRETSEIAGWVVAYRTLLGLVDELQARPQ